MSIANVFVEKDRAIIGVDSEVLTNDGSRFPACKWLLLPQMDAVVTFRGNGIVFCVAATSLLGYYGTFDSLAADMPHVVSQAFENAVSQATALRICIDSTWQAQFGLVGNSIERERMALHVFKQERPGAKVESFFDQPQLISPFRAEDAPRCRDLGIRSDQEGMIALARYQKDMVQDVLGDKAVAGGALYVAELEKGRLSVQRTIIL